MENLWYEREIVEVVKAFNKNNKASIKVKNNKWEF